MKYNLIEPKAGDVVQIRSDLWYVFVGGGNGWREMTITEQLEYSK